MQAGNQHLKTRNCLLSARLVDIQEEVGPIHLSQALLNPKP